MKEGEFEEGAALEEEVAMLDVAAVLSSVLFVNVDFASSEFEAIVFVSVCLIENWVNLFFNEFCSLKLFVDEEDEAVADDDDEDADDNDEEDIK